ncbi:hypothetical protein LWM68_06770 [Niabella sp. W65]|nr:hypothetical protein [Niabella sp. W65]MCH7362497.1 hypothetical protein [Niabella sp. W65]ULT38454.1 hypothetical protein KRR40_25415 [Niabella sp. I65]
MAKCRKAAWLAVVGLILPFMSRAQGVADEMRGMHGVLEQLYDEMIPLCSQLIGVGQGLAGFAAMWYIASRVWGHLSRAEPIDFYPLFRPFVIGFCVMIFPSVLGLINGVMKPTVTATAAMVENSDKAISVLLQKRKKPSRKRMCGKCMWEKAVAVTGTSGINTHTIMRTLPKKVSLKASATTSSSPCPKPLTIFAIR